MVRHTTTDDHDSARVIERSTRRKANALVERYDSVRLTTAADVWFVLRTNDADDFDALVDDVETCRAYDIYKTDSDDGTYTVSVCDDRFTGSIE